MGFYLSDEPASPKAFVTGVASPPLFEYTLAGSRSDARLRQFPFNYILLWKLVETAKARGASILAMVTEGDREVRAMADHLIVLPHSNELLSSILEVVPLQLLAYHIGVLRGCDVDQPRNLAKSVTVE